MSPESKRPAQREWLVWSAEAKGLGPDAREAAWQIGLCPQGMGRRCPGEPGRAWGWCVMQAHLSSCCVIGDMGQ